MLFISCTVQQKYFHASAIHLRADEKVQQMYHVIEGQQKLSTHRPARSPPVEQCQEAMLNTVTFTLLQCRQSQGHKSARHNMLKVRSTKFQFIFFKLAHDK